MYKRSCFFALRRIAGVCAVFAAAALLHGRAEAGDQGSSCAPEFLYPTEYPSAGNISPVLAIDFDGDGYLDLLEQFYSATNGIVVRLGQPDGGLGPMVVSSTQSHPVSMTAGRFINAAPPGVVVGTQQGELYFHAGNGDGTFQPGVQIAPEQVLGLQAADVNDDGNLDLLGIPGFSMALSVRLGNGNGTFQPPVVTPSDRPFNSFAVGNLDAGDLMDVVLAASDGTLEIYAGLGGGTFGPPTTVPVGGSNLISPRLGDLNGDGSLDIVVSFDDTIGVLKNNGDGTFQAAVLYFEGIAFTLADFDGDGVLDVGATDYDGVLALLLGTGDGSFVSGPSYKIPGAGVLAADFGADGAVDVVSAYGLSSVLSFVVLTRGLGDGRFESLRFTPTAVDRSSSSTAASADFDEDGRPDVVMGEVQQVNVYRNIGEGAFQAGAHYDFTEGYVAAISTGDFDVDGHVDLAVLLGSGDLKILLGSGDGTFSVLTTITPAGSDGGYALTSGDFDGNGRTDLAVGTRTPGDQGLIAVYWGRGDGFFDDGPAMALPSIVTRLASSDLRGLGRSDLLALLFSTGDSLRIFLSAGDGTFAAPVSYDGGETPDAVVTGDFHQTGHQDVLVGRSFDNTLALFPGQGDGSLGAPVILGAASYPSRLATADFNLDGLLDIVTAGGHSVVLLGTGGGNFESPLLFRVLGSAVFAGDFDGNGYPDAVYTDPNIDEGGIATLLNARLGVRVPDASAVVGSAATLTALAGGFGPLTYQWRKGGVPLTDGGTISGSQTATLTIDPVAFGDAGSYDVLVTDSCGPATSNAATLSVEFADVPVASIFHDDILAIATAGITGGCGGGNYCPTSPVRRDQMAVFLLKAEHGSAYTPPACTGVFADVPCPSTFADWVEQLAAEGVTGGCGGGNYCPGASVTRAQMAVFLLKTLLGSAYLPPAASGVFGDVPVGSFAADFIEDLHTRGITGGCSTSPLLYCPNNPVLRQQMATFLVRTFFP